MTCDPDTQEGRSQALKIGSAEICCEADNMRGIGGPGHYTLLFLSLELALKSYIVLNDENFRDLDDNMTDKRLKDFSHGILKLYNECLKLGIADFEHGCEYAEWIDEYYFSTRLRYQYAKGGHLPDDRDIFKFIRHVNAAIAT